MAANVNEQAFLAAAFPEPFRILGCDLLPFSVGHHMLLAQLGNRFVATEEQPGAIDVFQLLFVCSRPYARAAAGVRGRPFRRFLQCIEARLLIRKVLVWLGLLNVQSVEPRAFVDAISAYLLAHSKGPELAPDIGQTKREPGTPFIQFVSITLLSRLNHTFTEAMAKPWGHALHDVFAFWELEGRIRLVSQEDRDTWEEHQQFMVEMSDKIAELEKSVGLSWGKDGS